MKLIKNIKLLLLNNTISPVFFFFLIFIYSCSDDNSKLESSNKNISNDNDIIKVFEARYSYDEHPCLRLTKSEKPLEGDDLYNKIRVYSASSEVDGYSDIDAFKIIMDSAFLFQHYTEFLRVLNTIIHRKEISDYYNPKYYFLEAIENIRSSNYKEAHYNLKSFLTIQENYFNNRENFWVLGCHEHDIDWLLSFKNSKLYLISLELEKFLVNKLASKDINYKELSDKLYTYDDNPNRIDLVDNIVYSIDISLTNDHEKNQSFINDKISGALITSIGDAYNDQKEYYLSTQLEIVGNIKYFEVKKYYNNIDWVKVEENINAMSSRPPHPKFDFNLDHLYSMMRLYEYGYSVFGIRDKEVYDRIRSIINYKICDEESSEDGCDPYIKNNEKFFTWLRYFDPNNNLTNEDHWLDKIKQSTTNINHTNYRVSEFIEFLYSFSTSSNIDSSSYYILSNFLVNSKLFDAISTDSIGWNIKKPNKKYISIINNFNELGSRYDTKGDIDLLIKNISTYFYTMYKMNSPITMTLIEEFSESSKPKAKNEGNHPLLQSWKFVKGYFPKK